MPYYIKLLKDKVRNLHCGFSQKICAQVAILFGLSLVFLLGCKPSGDERMLEILQQKINRYNTYKNGFAPAAKLIYFDSLIENDPYQRNSIPLKLERAEVLIQLGKAFEATQFLKMMLDSLEAGNPSELAIKDKLALAYLRLGEENNCIANHSTESCVFPIRGRGVHVNTTGSDNAIGIYSQLLEKNINDYQSRWLLNLAYMTVGGYPHKVPQHLLIPDLDVLRGEEIVPFEDIAASLKIAVDDQAGGSITEDFDNDGYIDIVTSSMSPDETMHYFRNNGDGTFSDHSKKSGLSRFGGGLNMVQTDYNNDGFKDIFVLRGGWTKEYGDQPNSLLRNNGNGTFSDVTIESGLLSFFPTQTATWNDFNNDGWLDVFIGNESATGAYSNVPPSPSELYINNQDGTFTEVAAKAGCQIVAYVKGVVSADYDKDGKMDIYLSTINGRRILLKNQSTDQEVKFEDVTATAFSDNRKFNSFSTFFWDYDNDGWSDILVNDYTYDKPLSFYHGAYYLNEGGLTNGYSFLYRNNHDGTFSDVTDEVGLNIPSFSMGANFGDINNDGYLDIYLGTGNPDFRSLVPNKMYLNVKGEKFIDITSAAKVGNVQKGHGVSFADMDNDGDQDIHIDMGGAFIGDSYVSSFFRNPGQNNNNWICISLEGVTTNKSAIGSTIQLNFTENGVKRSVFRDVNSGGSFGASPLRKEIGLGEAKVIDEIIITWHGSNTHKQVFKNVAVNQFIKLKEGDSKIEKKNLKKLDFQVVDPFCEVEPNKITLSR